MFSYRGFVISRKIFIYCFSKTSDNFGKFFFAPFRSLTYRNRYTHFSESYPYQWSTAYKIYITIISSFVVTGGYGLHFGNIFSNFPIKPEERITKAECQSILVESSENNFEKSNDTEKNEKRGFRYRKFVAYEDRIRAYSTPDKIFRYFATLKCLDENGNGQIFMTPDDFLRAITPGTKQPNGLALDSYKSFDPKHDKLKLSIPTYSIFYRFGENALISFSDFIFLLSIISTPQRQFEIAFRMFDINGDGDLDANEFELVRSVILETTPMGKRHRDHSTTGNTLKPVHHSALHRFFFGETGKDKLTISRFTEFQAQLQEEITRLEFNRLGPVEGLISEQAFAKSLLTYAGYSENKRRLMLRRVKNQFTPEKSKGISFKQFLDFGHLLRSISDLDKALSFYNLVGAAIDQETFLHMARVVANVQLNSHLVNVVFTLFDEDGDGNLSEKEFLSVMKNRLLRGLDKPMDTGFVRFISSLVHCAQEQFK